MTYAPTVRYLEAQALAAGAASFWHGKQQTQSINYNAAFPQAHLFLMPAPLLTLTNGPTVQYRVVMAFYGNDTHESPANLAAADSTGELLPDASLRIQDEMDQLTQAFIGALLEDGQFDLGEQVDRAPVLREGSQIGTGFVITFTLSARAQVC